MKFLFFIGIDVSKKKLDVAVRDHQQLLFHVTVDNSAIGLNDFKSDRRCGSMYWQRNRFAQEPVLLWAYRASVAGLYSQCLLDIALQNGYALWLESSLRIKKSIGLTRGKNDKIDAIRISEYAFRYADKAVAWEPEREKLMHLRQLVALRKSGPHRDLS